jgi:hypothetical protein
MTVARLDNPIDSLAPEVKAYATDSFCLRDDLERLHRVQHAGAPEAAILYCARILEAVAADALVAVELPSSPNVFSNLDALQQFNLLQNPTLTWAHALRRMGNLVRHIHRRVQTQDAELSVLFVERCLEWFFCRFRFRRHPQLLRLRPDEEPFAMTAGHGLRAWLGVLDAVDLDLRAHVAEVRAQPGSVFLQTPAIPALVAERLLDRKHHDEAHIVLEAALAEFPDDIRLNQLLVLYWSRTGHLDKARACLEMPIWERFKDDDETAGISAGVYKRLWLADKSKRKWLTRSHRAYEQGWEHSRHTNAYLGINTATTALWLGRHAEARQVAAGVRQLLQRRAAALARHAGDVDLVMNYWDQVTLAEAELLLGDLDASRRGYRAGFDTHREQRDNIDVTRKQLGELLQTLGLPESVETFLA